MLKAGDFPEAVRVPHARGPVAAARDDDSGAPRDGHHGTVVSQAFELAAGLHVPDVGRAVLVGHRAAAPVGAPGQPADLLVVAQGERRAIALAAPDEHRPAPDRRGGPGPRRAPGPAP